MLPVMLNFRSILCRPCCYTGSHGHYINSTSDIDWFKIIFSNAGAANFWMEGIPGFNYDLQVYVGSESGKIYTSRNGTGSNELITFDVSSGVAYYIKICRGAGNSGAKYLFRTVVLYVDNVFTNLKKSDKRLLSKTASRIKAYMRFIRYVQIVQVFIKEPKLYIFVIRK